MDYSDGAVDDSRQNSDKVYAVLEADVVLAEASVLEADQLKVKHVQLREQRYGVEDSDPGCS